VNLLILHTSDLHLGTTTHSEVDASTGLSKRIDDYFDCFDKIIEYAVTNNADVVMICGDVFNTSSPTPTILKMFASRLNKLKKAGIAVVMISGNHDLPKTEGRVCPIEIYSEIGMDNFHYISEPTYVDLQTKDNKKVRIFAIPYIHPIKIFNKQQALKKEKKELNYETVVKAYRDEYKEWASKFEKIGNGDADYCILMSHMSVADASKGSEEPITLLGGEFTLLPSILHSDIFDYVALGHIHRHQCLNWKTPIIYSGSIEKSDISEMNEKKGFVKIESGSKLKWEFVELPTRKMMKIEVDATGIKNIKDRIVDELKKNDIKDAIVRLVIKVSKKSRPSLDYSEIRKLMSDAFFVEPQYERVQENIPTQTLFSETLSANESLIKYLGTLRLSKKDKGLLQRLGLEIIKEVEGELEQ
jgi:exonuclease SbcD